MKSPRQPCALYMCTSERGYRRKRLRSKVSEHLLAETEDNHGTSLFSQLSELNWRAKTEFLHPTASLKLFCQISQHGTYRMFRDNRALAGMLDIYVPYTPCFSPSCAGVCNLLSASCVRKSALPHQLPQTPRPCCCGRKRVPVILRA